MTVMLAQQKRQFPSLAAWVDSELGLVPEREMVWVAFRRNSRLSAAHALEALSPAAMPVLFVEQMGKLRGLFHPSKPNLISIDLEIATVLEENPNDPARIQLVESTVLHELVHWGWALVGGGPEPEEMGWKFEDEAYGARVARDLVSPVQEEELGGLSRKYESNGKPDAAGRDTNGGWSYGTYQISSRQGTLAEFIKFLTRRPGLHAFASALDAAGGADAALRGDPGFLAAWRTLAGDAAFVKAQHAFIKATHYDPLVEALRPSGLLVEQRSRALRDVVWSVSVQHRRNGTHIFTRASATLTPEARLDDALLINAVYHERSNVERYFARSSPSERAAVLNRFRAERLAALELLAAEA